MLNKRIISILLVVLIISVGVFALSITGQSFTDLEKGSTTTAFVPSGRSASVWFCDGSTPASRTNVLGESALKFVVNGSKEFSVCFDYANVGKDGTGKEDMYLISEDGKQKLKILQITQGAFAATSVYRGKFPVKGVAVDRTENKTTNLKYDALAEGKYYVELVSTITGQSAETVSPKKSNGEKVFIEIVPAGSTAGVTVNIINPFSGTSLVKDPNSVAVVSGKSVIHYLEIINTKLLLQGVMARAESEQEKQLLREADAKVTEAAKKATGSGTAKDNSNVINTVNWTNLTAGNVSTVIFDPVKIDGVSYQLKLIYSDRKLLNLGVSTLYVYVNNNMVPCKFFGGSIINLGSRLRFGWGEGHDVCEATTYANKYAVDATLSSNGGYKQFSITSPLIPDSCADSISQDGANSATRVLEVKC